MVFLVELGGERGDGGMRVRRRGDRNAQHKKKSSGTASSKGFLHEVQLVDVMADQGFSAGGGVERAKLYFEVLRVRVLRTPYKEEKKKKGKIG